MAKYSAQLVAKSSENKNVTTTLSNVNPSTAPVKIKQFAQMLNALTTNTYNETNYIVTTNLDTETPPVDTRQTPTLTFDASTPAPTTSADFNKTIYLNYDGDGVVYTRIESGCTNIGFYMLGQNEQGRVGLMLKPFDGLSPTGGTYVVGATGGTNYKPIEVEYNFTV